MITRAYNHGYIPSYTPPLSFSNVSSFLGECGRGCKEGEGGGERWVSMEVRARLYAARNVRSGEHSVVVGEVLGFSKWGMLW